MGPQEHQQGQQAFMVPSEENSPRLRAWPGSGETRGRGSLRRSRTCLGVSVGGRKSQGPPCLEHKPPQARPGVCVEGVARESGAAAGAGDGGCRGHPGLSGGGKGSVQAGGKQRGSHGGARLSP